MRTNIELDDALVVRIRKATGLASKRSIVDAALRYYAAALEEDPEPASRRLGDELRAGERDRAARSTPAERVRAALALGDEQLRLAAAQAGVSLAEARDRHEREKDRSRRRGR